MKYVDYKGFREKYCNGRDRNGIAVKRLVIHSTAGGSGVQAYLHWMVEDEGIMPNGTKRGTTYYPQAIGVTNYAVDFDGTLYCIITPDRMTWNSQAMDDEYENVSIEIQKRKTDNSDKPTDEQYTALAGLVWDLSVAFPEFNSIRTHDYYRKKIKQPPKPCPGEFDYEKFNSCLNKIGLKIDRIGEGDYSLSKV